MSVSTFLEKPISATRVSWPKSSILCVSLIALLSFLGLFSILRPVLKLYTIWMTDPLRSIGMFFPVVSVILVLREAKRMQWRMCGSWWGLVPIALAIVLGHVRESMMIMFEVAHVRIFLPHDSPVIFGYSCGIVLLFGGTQLFRRSLFPLGLLLCLNPVPHFFNNFVDLPLQYVSAHVARSFAIALKQPLTPDQLRLMFTPDFGIYIAPGCNGIRGAVTMGYFALITGFLFRFPLRLHVLTVAGAVMLGYLFNFLRLCLLVVFYVFALHIPSLQDHGKNVDYAIGSCLFVIAAVLLSQLVLRVSKRIKSDEQAAGGPVAVAHEAKGDSSRRTLTLAGISSKLAIFVVLLLLGSVSYARTLLRGIPLTAPAYTRSINLAELYPQRLGTFSLVRAWKDGDGSTAEDYDWAEYRSSSDGELITIGIAPAKGVHDAILCHLARGEKPAWRGTSRLLTSDGQDVAFSSFFYNDGVSQMVEASTLCSASHCGENSTLSSPFKMLYSNPLPQSLVDEAFGTPVPVLIRAETSDTSLPPEEAKKLLLARLHIFVSGTSLVSLSGNYFPH